VTAGGDELSKVERDLLAVATAVGGTRGRSRRPGWRKSKRSGSNPRGNCVEVTAGLPAGGLCRCGNDPDCSYCHGTGTVWI
jgi:hypothetical protein